MSERDEAAAVEQRRRGADAEPGLSAPGSRKASMPHAHLRSQSHVHLYSDSHIHSLTHAHSVTYIIYFNDEYLQSVFHIERI